MRDRLAKRLPGLGPTQARLEEFLLWGLSLISVYVQAVIPEAERRRWTAQRRGELIYELLVIVAGRTHLLRPYRETVLDDDDAWQRMEAGLTLQPRGTLPTHPLQQAAFSHSRARAHSAQARA